MRKIVIEVPENCSKCRMADYLLHQYDCKGINITRCYLFGETELINDSNGIPIACDQCKNAEVKTEEMAK